MLKILKEYNDLKEEYDKNRAINKYHKKQRNRLSTDFLKSSHNIPKWNMDYEKAIEFHCFNSNKEFVSNWDYLSKYQKLSVKLMLHFKHKLNWNLVSIHQELDRVALEELADYLNWNLVSIYQKLDSDDIEYFNDYVNWTNISKAQKLEIDFMDKWAEKLKWRAIAANQTLNTYFIDKWANYLNWTDILTYQRCKINLQKNQDCIPWDTYIIIKKKIDIEFLEKNIELFNLNFVIINQPLPTAFVIKYIKLLNVDILKKYQPILEETEIPIEKKKAERRLSISEMYYKIMREKNKTPFPLNNMDEDAPDIVPFPDTNIYEEICKNEVFIDYLNQDKKRNAINFDTLFKKKIKKIKS